MTAREIIDSFKQTRLSPSLSSYERFLTETPYSDLEAKMKTLILAAILTALSLPGMAQDKGDPNRTGGVLNGRGWLAMSYNQKAGYLLGYGDLSLITDERVKETIQDCAGKDLVAIAFPRLTSDEIAKGLNTVYAEPANANIRISFALAILAFKVHGSSEYFIQGVTEEARKDAERRAK